MRYTFTLLLALLASLNLQAQDNFFLNKVSSLQLKQADGLYHEGMFRTLRTKRNEKKMSEDNNIFFTGLIAYTLQSIHDSLSSVDQPKATQIAAKAKTSFPYYKDRNGGITYNFYQVRPEEKPFPGADHWVFPDTSMRIPDDLDDTSILYLAQETNDSLNQAVKDAMVKHSMKDLYTSTFRRFRDLDVYKTWFAANMNQDTDLCVLTNTLLFVVEKDLEMTAMDTTSAHLIKMAVEQNLHLRRERLIAPHYQNPSITLYHIARIISRADMPVLNSIKGKVIADLRKRLLKTKSEMEKVILLTSLFRLGEPTNFELDIRSIEEDMDSFYWCLATPFRGMKFPIRRFFEINNVLQEYYKCEGYYWTLLLELQSISKATLSERAQNRVLSKQVP